MGHSSCNKIQQRQGGTKDWNNFENFWEKKIKELHEEQKIMPLVDGITLSYNDPHLLLWKLKKDPPY